jgi:hypothetical protein
VVAGPDFGSGYSLLMFRSLSIQVLLLLACGVGTAQTVAPAMIWVSAPSEVGFGCAADV